MISISLSQLQKLLNAQLSSFDDLQIDSVSTDTRNIQEGALFVALIGDRFDGHEFIQQAQQNGAKALLVSKAVESDLPQLLVKDTKLALGQIGAWVKEQAQVKTVAITGSCGKTTVKEMLATILAMKGKTLFTAGNFNNDIGVPLTLLRLELTDKFAVIELGANHIGEIAYTTKMVKPDVALVTNLTAAHLEGFGSIQGVAQAKGEIFQGLSDKGVAIVNNESRSGWQEVLANKTLLSIGTENGDFSTQNIQVLENGCYQFDLVTKEKTQQISLSLPGRHNVSNALLAIAAATSICDISLDEIAKALASVNPVKGRGAISFPRKGIRLIDDSYNASLSAMKAAVDLLDSFSGEKIIILADMAEMGEHSASVHKELADYVQNSSIQTVLTFGKASKVISDKNQGKHFDEQHLLIDYVIDFMNEKTEVSVLVKGANGMKMSKVVSAIEEAF